MAWISLSYILTNRKREETWLLMSKKTHEVKKVVQSFYKKILFNNLPIGSFLQMMELRQRELYKLITVHLQYRG